MKKINYFLPFIAIFFFLLPAKAAPLTVHPANPRYVTNETGKAIYLTGSHTWYLIQKNTSARQTDNSYARMEEYLDLMEGTYGQNFQRVWINFSSLGNTNFPWARTGPGTASDGGLKFNMSQFDQSYFDLVRQRILQMTNRGMYVSVMFFGSGNGFRDSWSQTAWHPNNNINSALANAFSLTDGNTFYTTNSSALEIQRALVRKTIDTLNDIDNLMWEVINEGKLPEGQSWQYGMINYVKSYESTKAKQHLVGMTGGWSQSGLSLINSPADWISPDDDPGDYLLGGDPAYTNKVIISDTDHLAGWGYSDPAEAQDMRKWVWRTFTRGHNPIFMDSYDAYINVNNILYNNGTVMSAFNPIRANMGYTLEYANKMNLAAMIPSFNTAYCSTAYCLRNPGNEYLVYQPNSGLFNVNLSAGAYTYEWFNPNTGAVAGTGNITVSAGSRSFTPPFSGDAVLYIKKADANTAPSAPTGVRVI